MGPPLWSDGQWLPIYAWGCKRRNFFPTIQNNRPSDIVTASESKYHSRWESVWSESEKVRKEINKETSTSEI